MQKIQAKYDYWFPMRKSELVSVLRFVLGGLSVTQNLP